MISALWSWYDLILLIRYTTLPQCGDSQTHCHTKCSIEMGTAPIVFTCNCSLFIFILFHTWICIRLSYFRDQTFKRQFSFIIVDYLKLIKFPFNRQFQPVQHVMILKLYKSSHVPPPPPPPIHQKQNKKQLTDFYQYNITGKSSYIRLTCEHLLILSACNGFQHDMLGWYLAFILDINEINYCRL